MAALARNVGPIPAPETRRDSARRAVSAAGLTGVPVSPGIAMGPAFLAPARLSAVAVRRVTDVAAEWSRLQKGDRQDPRRPAVPSSRDQRAGGRVRGGQFGAHQLILASPALLEAVEARISAEHLNAEAAWQQVIEAIVADFLALEDKYLRSRAADVLDVGWQVLGELGVPAMPQVQPEHPSILVTSVLSPSDVACLDPAKVLGICGELGGATSHSAILIRAPGIPAVAGLNDVGRYIATRQTVALDGTAGCVWLNPDRAVLADLRNGARGNGVDDGQGWPARGRRHPGWQAHRGPGQHQRTAGRAGGLELGAEGAGLFRTELLFRGPQRPPGRRGTARHLRGGRRIAGEPAAGSSHAGCRRATET